MARRTSSAAMPDTAAAPTKAQAIRVQASAARRCRSDVMSSTSSACMASPGVPGAGRENTMRRVRVILFLGDPRAEYRLGAINLQHQGKSGRP